MGAQAGTSPAAASKEVKGTKKEEFYNFKHAHTDTHTQTSSLSVPKEGEKCATYYNG